MYFAEDNVLDSLIASHLAPLVAMGNALDTLIHLHQTALNQFSSETQPFINGNSPTFSGETAQRLANEVQGQLGGATDRISDMTTVRDAITTCLARISAIDASYYAGFIANDLADFVNYAITGAGDFGEANQAHLTAGYVFAGSGHVRSILLEVRDHYRRDRLYYYTTYEPQQDAEWEAEEEAQAVVDPWINTLPQWADEVIVEINTWHSTVTTAISTVLRWRGEMLENEQALAQQIFSQYNTGKPIGITQIGDNTILVTLAGTEFKFDQANSPATDAQSGSGNNKSVYEQEVDAAIRKYIKDHNLPPGTQVEIAGHSLGGMIAQDVASQNAHNAQGAYSYTVENVVTFGSPNLNERVASVRNYQQYFDQYDDIPYLSKNVIEKELLAGIKQDPLNPYAPVHRKIAYLDAHPQAKAAYLGETYVQDSSQFTQDPHGGYIYSSWLGDQNTTFTVNQTGATQYYAAPA